MLFNRKKTPARPVPEGMEPVLLVSICTGETTAAFREIATGKTLGICVIRSHEDLEEFRTTYGIEGEIPKIY